MPDPLFLGKARVWFLPPPTLETVELDGEFLNEWLAHESIEQKVLSINININNSREAADAR